MITTDAIGLDTGDSSIAVSGGTLPLYFARPAAQPGAPTVLVVQEIFGVHEHIRDICRRLAKLGYLAVAPELYFRQGDPRAFHSVPEILENVVAKVPDAQVMTDLDACAQWAAENGGDPARLFVTGFCWGGRITWLYAAHNPHLKAGVAWYGRLNIPSTPNCPRPPMAIAGELKAPVLGLYGARDASIPVEDVAAMQAALALANSPSQIVLYPNSEHAFHADYRPSYNSADAADGWRRLTSWFRQHG